MPAEPGKLLDFGPEARKDWDDLIAELFEDGKSPQALAAPDEHTQNSATVDWGAFPVRAQTCLGSRDKALRLLDWHDPERGDRGRTAAQEEYLEWRVVRDDAGAIKRIEMTSEFREYWGVLAAHHPERTVELVRGFAGEQEADVDPSLIYGGLDPFGDGVSPAKRKVAFERAMESRDERPPRSPYNNGVRALTCMQRDDNTLGALVALVLRAVFPYVGTDDGEPLSGSEAIAAELMGNSAVDCRNSDPTVVGKLVDLAAHGHLVALDDPIGVYVVDVQNQRLEMPDGDAVPIDWFEFSRGARAADGQDGLERPQRLAFELPADADFGIEDLVDTDSAQKVRFGAQIADLVQLGVHARISPPDAVAQLKPIAVERPTVPSCVESPDCPPFTDAWDTFERSAAGVPVAPGPEG